MSLEVCRLYVTEALTRWQVPAEDRILPHNSRCLAGRECSSGQEEGCPSVAKTSVERGGGQEAERILIEHSLATEKEMLRRAEEACASIRARIEALSTNLASVSVSESSDTTVTASGLRTLLPTYSPEQKLAIFRGLFRGREDVYPVRWEKSKTGPSGYAPECSNKFVRPVCDIEHVRCRACPNRVYRSVTDDAILSAPEWQACHGHLSAFTR